MADDSVAYAALKTEYTETAIARLSTYFNLEGSGWWGIRFIRGKAQ